MVKMTPSMLVFSASLGVLASVLYHVVQKLTPQDVNPAVTLLTTYVTAIVLTLGLLFFYPLKENLPAALGKLNWASFALGLAILGIEISFLLAYRAGWRISLLAVVVNVAATLVLIPIGLAFFGEKLTPVNVIGLILSLVGLVLVNLKP
ncbi:MAG: EamA family transporter [Chloroflexota bacterium]